MAADTDPKQLDPLDLAYEEQEEVVDESGSTAADEVNDNPDHQEVTDDANPPSGEGDTEVTNDNPGNDPETDDQEPLDAEDAPANDDPEAVEDEEPLDIFKQFPKEEWDKLNHNVKRQILHERKRATAAINEANKAYDDIERFVQANNLTEKGYVEAVQLGGAIARNDPNVLPHLEAYAARIRQAHGIAAPDTGSMPMDEINALIEEAEDIGADPQIINALRGKLGAKGPKQEPQNQQPAATPPAPQQPTATPETTAIVDYLVENGIQPQQFTEYMAKLIQFDPSLRTVPAGKRIAAVVKAHTLYQMQQKDPAQPQKPVQQQRPQRAPVVGRNPRVPRKTVAPSADPLDHAYG